MKVYISADIEGVAGIAHWDETDKAKADWTEFRDRMTADVAAVCRGALAAGATTLAVRDAHGSGRNLLVERLPEEVSIIRSWSGNPMAMVQGVDEGYDAAAFIGYHAAAGSSGNPLAHTWSGRTTELRVNGERLSEFQLHAWACALHRCPVVLVAGDEALCEEVRSVDQAIVTVPTLRGVGESTVSRHPRKVQREIESGIKDGLARRDACRLALPESFAVEIEYKEPKVAYKCSFYPGAELRGARTVAFSTDDCYDLLRAVQFIA